MIEEQQHAMKDSIKTTGVSPFPGRTLLLSLGLTLLLGGCASWKADKPKALWPELAAEGGHSTAWGKYDAATAQGSSAGSAASTATPGQDEAAASRPLVYRGTGKFVAAPAAGAAPPSGEPGDITLNFQNADLNEVVSVVLGDLLKVNYVLDPAVQGSVTIQTTRPLRQQDLLPTLETLLRIHGFAAVKSGDTYRVVPLDKAVRGQLSPQLGGNNVPLPSGYSLRVVPLAYISAAEMAEILQPIAPVNSIIRVDTMRNLLIIAGTGMEMGNILDAIEVFDVDWVKGVSVGFFPLHNARPGDVETKLQAILGATGTSALQGMFRIAVVDSANGLLVVTPQADYLRTIGQWIERLDRIDAVGGGEERELYVYRVKSGEAATLAELLSQVVGGARATVAGKTSANLAPNERPVTLSAPAATDTTAGAPAALPTAAPIRQRAGQDSELVDEGIRIVADESRNSLLITATSKEYRKIEKALTQLDIPPLQVMIEATIIEVKLEGDLKFGLQWFFNTNYNGNKATYSLDGTLDSASSAGLGGIFPGFNFAVINPVDTVRLVFSALAEDSLINVLSSPSVMVENSSP